VSRAADDRHERERSLVLATRSARALPLATTSAAVGAALVGGVFFAFSTFIMPALDELPAAEGIEAMQAVNRTAVGPGLMLALFGTAALCAGVGVIALRHRDRPGARWLLAGSAMYLVGAIGVTMAANVPLNDSLAAVHPHAAGAAGTWADYLTRWTAFNHVRTAASVAAAGLLLVGRRRMQTGA
jgi:uncharacterized membrane protein